MAELETPNIHVCDWCGQQARFVSVNAKKYRCNKSITRCPGFARKCELTRSTNVSKEARIEHMRKMNKNALATIKDRQTDVQWRRKRGENISKAKSSIPSDRRSEWEQYENLVDRITRDSWIRYQNKINPDGLPRGKDYELDHRYSKINGWLNGVPPEVIGHWSNLEILPRYSNRSKRTKCSITLEELYSLIETYPIS
jgi:hypothetical protein